MNAAVALLVSALLLVANGFFVATEFALVASRRHRLEQDAMEGSIPARFAVRAMRELSLTLAGVQLGITVCSLGLGALAEPAVAHMIEPGLHGLGLPEQMSYVIGFTVALAIVVFSHTVIGEMVPKSWAISHPERAALLLAMPFRAFAWLVRPLLWLLNEVTDVLLRAVRIEPQRELSTSQGPGELRVLIRESQAMGLLGKDDHDLLARSLEMQTTALRRVMASRSAIVAVAAEADLTAVQELSRRSGRSRLPVFDGDLDTVIGVIHVRDALIADAAGKELSAAELMRPALLLDARTPVYAALRTMREGRTHLALVTASNRVVGLVTLEDLVEELIGEFEDETDSPGVPRRGRSG